MAAEAGGREPLDEAADRARGHCEALERMVGPQALELELLKGALKHAPRPRSACTSVVTGPAASPLPGGAS